MGGISGKSPREIPIGDVIKLLSILNARFLYTADFARILHNSTPRRNHIFWAAFEYLYSFCIYGGGVEFSVFPYTLVMASNTAYCTAVHTRDLLLLQVTAVKSNLLGLQLLLTLD